MSELPIVVGKDGTIAAVAGSLSGLLEEHGWNRLAAVVVEMRHGPKLEAGDPRRLVAELDLTDALALEALECGP
ncbi:MAG: hypothetical protein HKN46_10115 [Acidimicrobiia bacterium]|nr:hypothetical protein [Acidimicrobiia bacterium]